MHILRSGCQAFACGVYGEVPGPPETRFRGVPALRSVPGDAAADYRGPFPCRDRGRAAEMQMLSEADMDGLRWTRGSAPHTYELKSRSDPVATLHWERPVETLAHAEAAGVKWTLRRHGFLRPIVTVQDAEGANPLAVLHVHVSNSLLQLPGGAAYRWTRTGFWIPAWEFQTQAGKELVDFEPVREDRRLEGGLVGVSPEGRTDPNLLLLLILGWYFIVQAWTEDEAVVASRAILDATSG